MSDDFHARYRLLKCTAVDDGVRTHNAQETTTSRVVMVHIVDAAGPGEVQRLRAALGRLPVPDRSRVLEMAVIPAGFAVVTEFIPGMHGFPTWLQERVGDWRPGEDPADAVDGTVDPSTAETLPPTSGTPALWASSPPRGHAAPPSEQEAPIDPLPDDPTSGPESEAPVAIEFSVGPPTLTMAAPTGGATGVTGVTPAPRPPGEFTRLFMAAGQTSFESTPPAVPAGAPPAAPAEASPDVPATPREPGEFTRMFQPAVPLAPPGPPPAPTPAPPPVAPPVAVAQPVPAPVPTSPPAPPAGLTPVLATGEFTGLFKEPAAPRPSVAPQPSPFAPTTPPPPAAWPPAPPTPPAPAPAPAMGSVNGATGALAARQPAVVPPPPAPPAASPLFPASAPMPALPPLGPTTPPLPPPPPGNLATPSPLGSSAPPLPGFGGVRPPAPPPQPAAPPAFGAGGSPFGGPAGAPPAGGSEYTRMIRQSVTPPPPAPVASASAALRPPPPPRRTIPMPLIIVINVVLLLTAVLVLYFVLRPTPPTPVPVAAPAAGTPAAPATAPAAPTTP